MDLVMANVLALHSRPRHGRTGWVVGALLILLVVPGTTPSVRGMSATSPASPKVPKLGDGGNLSTDGGLGILWDSESPTLLGPGIERSYWINVSSSGNQSLGEVELQTVPTVDWAGANAFPWGADNLPPLGDWHWWVTAANGSNDSANWTADSDGLHLDRISAWGILRVEVHGIVAPSVVVAIEPTDATGTNATGTGFVMNAPGYADAIPPDPNYANLTASIHPALVRISLGIGGQLSGWNTTTNQPVFEFGGLDEQFHLAETIGASVLLSLPAGTFGDGNDLPNGTPLNLSVQVSQKEGSGYFPTPSAYYAIVRELANHTYTSNESVAYWSIGNEVVLNSSLQAEAFASVINAAIDALQPHYRGARVGTDDMMDPRYLPEFANLTPRVGFLSLHRYASDGLCVTSNGSYCPPSGGGAATPTPEIFQRPQYQGGTSDRLPPQTAADEWYNLTGRHVPVLATEVNLGYVGGPGAPNQSLGTDPRIQSTIGAAWLGEFLIASSVQNVSAINFFAFTSGSNQMGTLSYAYGGFGFGLTNESANGTVTKFAPYWTMELWGTYLPDGAPAVGVNDSDPATVAAYAVRAGPDVDVALVNQVAANTTVHLAIAGNFSLNRTLALDGSTYQESYDAATNSTAIDRAGIRVVHAPPTSNLTLHGYGFAVAVFGPAARSGGGSGSNGSGNGSGGSSGGNGSGSGNSSGSGNRSGSGSGNGSGSSQGGSGNRSGSGSSAGNNTTGGGTNTSKGVGDGSTGNATGADAGGDPTANRSAANRSGNRSDGPPPSAGSPPATSSPGSPGTAFGAAVAAISRTPARPLYGGLAAVAFAAVAVLAVRAGRATRPPGNRSTVRR